MRTILITVAAAGLGLLAACGGGAAGDTPAPKTPGSAGVAEPATFAEQATVGQKLYADNCASCHGDSGEGSPGAPRVVGLDKGALPLEPGSGAKSRKVPFKTAADVGTWVSKNMPPGQGGSLKEWEYWAIIAFDLKANGITSEAKVDATTAPTIALRK